MQIKGKKKDSIEVIVQAGSGKSFGAAAYRIFKNSALLLFVIVLWQVLPTFNIIKPYLLPPFSEVVATWFDLMLSGKLEPDIFISLRRTLTGFSCALFFGIPIGVAMGYSKIFSDYFSPFIHFCRQIPSMALFPVFIIFFGVGEPSKIVIVFWVSVWAILLNTINGVMNVDPLLIKASRSMGGKNIAILFTVILPDSVPSIMTGVRLGAGSSVISLVAAEMLGARAGLGFRVINSQYNFQIGQMYATILTIAVIGIIINQLLVLVEKRLTFWKTTAGNQ